MKCLMILALMCGLAHADSIGPVFALQQSPGQAPSYLGVHNIQLGQGTPLLRPTLVTPYLEGNYLAFTTSLAPTDGPMSLTLTIAGVTYTTGADVHGVASCVNSFVLPRTFYRPRNGVLTISYAGETRSYAFQFVDPVPEPPAFLLLATGLGLLALTQKWRIVRC